LEALVLSLLIPSRNRARYLKSAIASALSVESEKIEIIVSDNFSSDDSFAVANSFNDSRLRIVRPSKAMAMHEHWEFLLLQARGRWVTFIGDDDGVMPHAARYLEYLESKYHGIEAIVSPRAYYFWQSAYNYSEPASCFFSMDNREVIHDSKKQLVRCLMNEINYLSLPQMYSGGFHARSLVNRVLQSQGGHYFRSVTPDAYSALMGVLHTFRYLEVGIPLTWVGTSPAHSYGGLIECAKDHQADFVDMYRETPITMNHAFGGRTSWWPFGVYFFEAYVSASPFTDLNMFSLSKMQQLSDIWSEELISRGLIRQAMQLSFQLGTKPLSTVRLDRKRAYLRLINYIHSLARMCRRLINRLVIKLRIRDGTPPPMQALFFSSENHPAAVSTMEHANSIATEHYQQMRLDPKAR